jgi:hypothetical protein
LTFPWAGVVLILGSEAKIAALKTIIAIKQEIFFMIFSLSQKFYTLLKMNAKNISTPTIHVASYRSCLIYFDFTAFPLILKIAANKIADAVIAQP